MTFVEEQKKLTEEIEAVIEGCLPEETGHQKTVIEAMNYSVRAGGKRLRPMLLLLTCRMFGGESKAVGPFLAAIEMIHTYSLIHDDLPAMDDDDLRRGKPTTHKVYGEAVAILAGDALLNFSMETALAAFRVAPEESNRIAASIALLYRKSGIYGMIGGQTVDVETDGSGEVTREQLDFIYRLKTGALLEAAMMIGAILGGASDGDIKRVGEVAQDIGLAFQIRDDILDVTSDEATLGKPVGSDEKNEKATYVTFEGVKKAGEDVNELTERAIGKLSELPGEKEFLTELLRSLVKRES